VPSSSSYALADVLLGAGVIAAVAVALLATLVYVGVVRACLPAHWRLVPRLVEPIVDHLRATQ
jgi:hypothetical protein